MELKKLIKGLNALCITFVLCLVCACVAPKQRAINQLQAIHDDLEVNYTNYNVEKWKQFARDYREADSLIALYEYTPEEKEYIGTLRGEISGYIVKAAGQTVMNAIVGEGREIMGILNGMIDVLKGKEGIKNTQEQNEN